MIWIFIYLQVFKPLNLGSLSKWVDKIPKDVLDYMVDIAPMLKTMGYDPHQNPPKYGDADKEVIENTNNIMEYKAPMEEQGEKPK